MLTRLRHSRSVGIVRYHLYRDVLLARPRRHTCNLCQWQGRHFLTYYHRRDHCPQCGSSVRHRLLGAALDLPAIAARLPRRPRVLHLSAEYCLEIFLRPRAGRYVRADFAAWACDVRMDATRMAVASKSVDLVVACDMLEHIPDDRLVLSECHRVLRDGGMAILTVPQSDAAYATLEDPSIRTAAARAAVYGQPDHLRNYGADFADRVGEAGFAVTAIDASAFDEATVARNVLAPPPRADSWGWNNRRVYFAERR